MSSQFFGLNIGMNALSAYQAAITTTAHNISNVQTEGYSRQTTKLEASPAIRVYASYGSTGSGVWATEIAQERNVYLDIKYRENRADLGYFEQKLYYLEQMENIFADDSIQEGFSTIFNKMFNDLDGLNNGNASSGSSRTQFIHQAQSLCTYFNYVSDSLKELQKDANEEILNATKQINVMAEKISLLNKEINALELDGGHANELRDQRALLIDELSAFVNVETVEYEVANSYGANLGGTNFMVTINGQTLVDGNEYRTLTCEASKCKLNQNDATGMYWIVWSDTGADFAATTENAGGSLKALFDLRDGNNGENLKGTSMPGFQADKDGHYTSITMTNLSNSDVNALSIPSRGRLLVGNTYMYYDSWEAKLDENGNISEVTFALEEPINPLVVSKLADCKMSVGKTVESMGVPYYQQQVNEFLRNFTEMFNDIQKQGVTLDGDPMGAFFVGESKAGMLFDFEEWGTEGNRATTISSNGDGYYQLTAENVKVNNMSIKDASYFSTTTDIINGKESVDLLDKMMNLQEGVIMFRGAKATGFLEVLMSDVSVDTEKADTYYKTYSNMNTVITNQKWSVSGVDEDEEALNLVKFQNAYNLSSKVVSVLNEIYDKLINQTGVT